MGSSNSPAARRMMKALCCCDNRQIIEAVHRYTRELDDAQMIKLLDASRAYLDPYHRAVLESQLAASSQDSHRGLQLKTMFESFVAENPRALEQLPPPIIDGILRRAATNDIHLRQQFTPAWLQRYASVISGIGGVCTAALLGVAYIYFGTPRVPDSVLVPPSVSLKTAVKQPPALASIVHRPDKYKPRTSAIFERHAHKRISVAISTPHQSVALAMRQAVRGGAIATLSRNQMTRRTRAQHATARIVSTVVAALPNLASRAPSPQTSPQITRAPMPSGIQAIPADVIAVETKVVTQTVESSDAETSAQGTDPAPTRYCYARGSWRQC